MLGAYKVKAQMDIESMETKDGDNLSISGTFNLLSKQKTIEILDEQTQEGEVTWYASLKKAVDDLKEKKKRIRDKQQSITNLESGLTEGNIGERAPRWIPDESATICMRCDASFTTFRRRHHCRGCGWVICSKCCKKAPLEYLDNKIEKVCQKCYNLIVHQTLDSPDSPTNDSSPKKHNILDVKASDASLIASYLNMSADKGRSWMKRYFAVHDTFVLYSFKSDQDYSALTALALPGYQVEMVKNLHDKSNIFKISNKSLKKNYYFEADHKLHTKKWYSILEKVVKAELPDITQRFSSQSTSSASSGGASSDTYNNNNNNNSDISTDNISGSVKTNCSDQTISKNVKSDHSEDITDNSAGNTKTSSKKTEKTRKKSVDNSKTVELSHSKDST
ncbi:hypothetical protein LOTGIDRAFT_174933 [Lottia gigantea]|uniref:FYVE-type domain-containing protein n=1 Tax=Lottia gigantea TaxID=225164 RepID=V4ARB3_LOTGI|nr:hypothetical protein LOTGIDRAFT_174933 [Lottia gigantea]ESO96251.1 hypothetical protein LOTGIDRAFT_174933 [Lottia gigantea]